MTALAGMDVSKWQGAEHWSTIAPQIQFAFCKATEGGLAPGTPDAAAVADFGLDPQFRANWAGMKAAGLVRGAYHFARPDLGNSAATESAWFMHVVGSDLQAGDLVALDFEPSPSVNWLGWMTEWMERVKAGFGFNPFFYSFRVAPTKYGVSYAFIKQHGVDPGLWLSAPDGPVPAPPIGGWPFVAIQQRASGVPGGDIFFGTRSQLLEYGKPGASGLAGGETGVITPPPPPTPAPPPPAPTPTPPPVPVPAPPPVVEPVSASTTTPPRSLQDILVTLIRWLIDRLKA